MGSAKGQKIERKKRFFFFGKKERENANARQIAMAPFGLFVVSDRHGLL